jgi:hypothetical protein
MNLRVEHIFEKSFKNDNSFKEKENVFTLLSGGIKYNQHEVREIWHSGIKLGIETGLFEASIEGNRIQLDSNTPEGKHKEFLIKFYDLCFEYGCGIQYHPKHGLCVVDRYFKNELKSRL